MITVVATGVFDIIHPGHIEFLEEAKRLGDSLIVIVASDEMAKKKKRCPIIPERQRLKVVSSLKGVDKAILGDQRDIFVPMLKIKPDILVLGKNQDFDDILLEEELKKIGLNTKVVRINKFWDDDLNSSKKIIERIRV